MTSTIKSNFQEWRDDSKRVWRAYGFPIVILNKKWNTAKTILSILGIFSVVVLIIGIYGFSVGAVALTTPTNETNQSSPKIITIKIIHEIKLSDDLKNYIETKGVEAYESIKEDLK